MAGAARAAGGTVLARSFHKFEPRGVTGIVAIAESHLSIHTWPEFSYAAVDIFTCGENFDPTEAAKLIIADLESADSEITEIERGVAILSVATPA